MNEKNIPNELILEAEETTASSAKETPLAEKVAGRAERRPYVVCEIPALRGESRKVFRMSDGSEQAVFYPEPVHVFDKETQTFEDTDNSLAIDVDGKHIFISS